MLIYNKDITEEVSVFKVNNPPDSWVVRQYGTWARLGDSIWDHEPTDEELYEAFNKKSLIINRGYSVANAKIMKMIEDRMREQSKQRASYVTTGSIVTLKENQK